MAIKDKTPVEAWNFNNSLIGKVNGTELIATGADNFVPGKKGKGWRFDGTQDRVLQQGSFGGLILTTSSISWSYWIKFPTIASNTDRIVILLSQSTATTVAYGQLSRSSGNVQHKAVAGSRSLSPAPIVQDLDWHHVAASFNEVTGSNSIWVDTVEFIGNPGWAGPAYEVDRISVGSNWAKNSLLAYDLDSLMVWDKDLVQTDVDELFNGGDGLEYPFEDEAVGSTNVVRVGLFKIDQNSNVIIGQNVLGDAFMMGHDHRVIPDLNIPNSAGYPTVTQFLQLEAADDRALRYMDQTIIITS